MKSQVFIYNGADINFQAEDGSVMVNATQMAKTFDKRPAKWLELPSTQEFLQALSSIRKSDTSMVQSIMGSPESGGGTWMHEDVALEFARWLAPSFAIWCNDRIKELIKSGYTKLDSISRKDLAKMLLEVEEEKEALQAEKERQQKVIAKTERMLDVASARLEAAAPKIDFVNRVVAGGDVFPFSRAAKILQLPFGRNTLFEKLRDEHILTSKNEPYQEFIDSGYFEYKYKKIEGISSETNLPFCIPIYQTYITGKGLYWLSKKYGGKNPKYKEYEFSKLF